jgi:hypothetical protein
MAAMRKLHCGVHWSDGRQPRAAVVSVHLNLTFAAAQKTGNEGSERPFAASCTNDRPAGHMDMCPAS